MWYPDLGYEADIWRGSLVRAVGWLGAAHAFPRGPTPLDVRERLSSFARSWGESVEALGWPIAAGLHLCELCRAHRASGNFGVPAGEVLYVCPEMIAHYVDEHDYAPPAEFIAALMSAPIPGSDEYTASVARFRALFEEETRAWLDRPTDARRSD